MTLEELKYVYNKWSSCGRYDCYDINRNVLYRRERSCQKDMSLKDLNEIYMCYRCEHWVAKVLR